MEPTFLRDEMNAYYVDAMDDFNYVAADDNWKTNFNITDVLRPTQQATVLSTWSNSVSIARQFQVEVIFWAIYRVIVPSYS